jgi:Glyoxalase/Bleomycin resistance protein/Dioxygenase superfamily
MIITMQAPPDSFTQIAFVTKDWRKFAQHWTDVMGAGPFFILKLPPIEKKYRGRLVSDTFEVAISFVGETCLEIIQPVNNEPSMYREVLDSKGDGALHHTFADFRAMDDTQFNARRKKYADLGLQIACEFTIPGLGHNIFYDTLHSIGSFVELSQLSTQGFKVCQNMYEAHRDWDRKNPIRDILEAVPTDLQAAFAG